jgi:hypothetical protein
MAFLSEMGQAAIKPATGAYLNINKIPKGESVKVRLMSAKPVEGFEIWGTGGTASNQTRKPFRFDHEPTPDDIDAAFGADFIRAINPNTGTIEVPKYFMALSFYDLATAEIRASVITQKTIQREVSALAAMEEIPDITDIVMVISPVEKAYSVRNVPLTAQVKKDSDRAWKEALEQGYDLRRLFEGGNPFKAG